MFQSPERIRGLENRPLITAQYTTFFCPRNEQATRPTIIRPRSTINPPKTLDTPSIF